MVEDGKNKKETEKNLISIPPKEQGMYDPSFEKDSCGMGFVVDIKNRKSRKIIDIGLKIMRNLRHRGAVGADPLTGDGAGMLIQMPNGFLPAQRFSMENGTSNVN